MKPKLILFHTFGSNSDILIGMKQALNDNFDTHIIDLPGFVAGLPPLEIISYEAYADYAQRALEVYKDEEILLGGMSFGFSIVTRLDLSRLNIKAIVALEPFIGYESVRISEISRKAGLIVLDTVEITKSDPILFNKQFLKFLTHVNGDIIDRLLYHYDSRTFIETLEIILKDDQTHQLIDKNRKYILLINPEDEMLKADFVVDAFKDTDHLLLYTDMPHSPQDLTADYFRAHMPDLKVVFDYLDL